MITTYDICFNLVYLLMATDIITQDAYISYITHKDHPMRDRFTKLP